MSAPARPAPAWARVSVPLLIGVIWLATTLVTGASTLWDRDEPRFSRATVEMVRSGQYLYPTFGGELRPHKPILLYWLMSVPVRLLGPTEIAARAVSPLALALTAWLTWGIGRRFLSEAAARLAVLLLATMPLVLLEGTAATADALLLACMTAALAVFAAALDRGRRPADLAALTLALGAALLAKGPVGLVVPGLVMAAALAALPGHPHRGALARLLAMAALGSMLLFLAWAVPADRATGGRLLREGLQGQFLHRIGTPMEGHGIGRALGLPFYAMVVLVGLAPASVALPAAARALWRFVPRPPAVLLAAWAAVPVAVMALSATQLPHYVLPVAPALALAAAAAWERTHAEGGATVSRPLAALAGAPWLVAAAGLAILGPGPSLRWGATVLAAVLLGGQVLVLRWGRAEARGLPALVLAAAVAEAGAVLLLLPAADRLKPVPRLAAALRAQPALPVARFGFAEPSLEFYLDRDRLRDLPDPAAVQAWLDEPGEALLVTTRTDLARLGPESASRLAEVAAAEGLDPARGRFVSLVALRRKGP